MFPKGLKVYNERILSDAVTFQLFNSKAEVEKINLKKCIKIAAAARELF